MPVNKICQHLLLENTSCNALFTYPPTSEKTLRLAQLSNENNIHKEQGSSKLTPRGVLFLRGQT